MPEVAFRLLTVDQAGNSSTWACPPLSCSSLVLSLGTSVQVTLSR